jgi:hypothetical protein
MSRLSFVWAYVLFKNKFKHIETLNGGTLNRLSIRSVLKILQIVTIRNDRARISNEKEGIDFFFRANSSKYYK